MKKIFSEWSTIVTGRKSRGKCRAKGSLRETNFQRLFPGALLFASCASSLLLFATTARAADREVLHGHVPTAVTKLNL